jgi:hypothetical protein
LPPAGSAKYSPAERRFHELYCLLDKTGHTPADILSEVGALTRIDPRKLAEQIRGEETEKRRG